MAARELALAEKCAIGIDLGGTNLRWAVVDSAGRRLYHDRMERPHTPEQIVAAIQEAVKTCAEANPSAVGAGVAVPGIVSMAGVTSINLGWLEYPLAQELRDLPVEVQLVNDMAAGALGELHFGRA